MSIKTWSQSLWQEWIRPLIIMIIVIGSMRSALADWNDVPTGSMKPTIVEGDRVIVNKLAYDLKIPFTTVHVAEWDNPQRGDIVVFFSPADEKRLVKRVVGLPGDLVELRDNSLLINGRPAVYAPVEDSLPSSFSNPHLISKETLGAMSHPIMISPLLPAVRTFGPLVVPDGHYFVMGDNRDNSYDSRFIGPIARKRIVGKAVGVAFSLDREKYFKPRAQRFFRSLL